MGQVPLRDGCTCYFDESVSNDFLSLHYQVQPGRTKPGNTFFPAGSKPENGDERKPQEGTCISKWVVDMKSLNLNPVDSDKLPLDRYRDGMGPLEIRHVEGFTGKNTNRLGAGIISAPIKSDGSPGPPLRDRNVAM